MLWLFCRGSELIHSFFVCLILRFATERWSGLEEMVEWRDRYLCARVTAADGVGVLEARLVGV